MRGPGDRLAIEALIPIVRRWVRQQSAYHWTAGHALSPEDREALGPHFTASTLEAVRVHEVEAVDNPWFAAPLVALGFDLDLSRAGGITFGDAVVVTSMARSVEARRSLLCHELIHVVQYRQLGVDGFVEAYLRGWREAGFVYERIPLEEEAYRLEGLYQKGTLGRVEDQIDAASQDA